MAVIDSLTSAGYAPAEVIDPVDAPWPAYSLEWVARQTGHLHVHGPGDEHWASGIASTWSGPCSAGTGLWPMCPTGSLTKSTPSTIETTIQPAFALFAGVRCSTRGLTYAELAAAARQRLERCESLYLELTLVADPFDALTSNTAISDVDVQVTTNASIQGAIGALEQASAVGWCNPPTWVHMSPTVLVLAASTQVIRWDPVRQLWLTPLGSPVVSGPGFTDMQMVYSTGPVEVHLGPVVVYGPNLTESTTLNQNDTVIRAERLAAVSWNYECGAYSADIVASALPSLTPQFPSLPGSGVFAEPTLTSISPTTHVSGGANWTLTANGTGFKPGSVIYVDGVARTTTYVSPTQVTTSLTVPGPARTVQVFVRNPGGGAYDTVTKPLTLT